MNGVAYLDGERALDGVRLQVDLHGRRVAPSRHQLVAQLLQGVAAVGDEFADEHLGDTDGGDIAMGSFSWSKSRQLVCF